MNDSRHQLYNCDSCLFKTISCHYVSEEEFELVRRTSVQLAFDKGETIIKQGAKSQQLVFLHRGIVKFNYQNDSGKNFIMTIVNGPKLLGGANLFFKETNIFSLVAVERCELCFIDSRALRNLAYNHGNYTLALCERTVEMFQSSIFNFISLAHKQVNGRIADILIYLWEKVYRESGYEFSLTRKELSEYAACSAENVISTLSKFNREGIISLEGRKIVINDLNKLYSISKTG
jgi:CRP/FNR family transcriptional regulator, polysaccharide utilization system transcription regulator